MYDRHKAKARRLKLGLNVKELAARVECAEVTIYQYEAGDRRPSIQTFVRLMHALRIPFSTLEKQVKSYEEYVALCVAEGKRERTTNPRADVRGIFATQAETTVQLHCDKLTAGREGATT
uniref:Helix-turn-helix domain-containing protein n=1 Tax=Streptomyces sp. NBC_00003 TaxID=2903608 RepID=A0AAU2VAH1_9ACTN